LGSICKPDWAKTTNPPLHGNQFNFLAWLFLARHRHSIAEFRILYGPDPGNFRRFKNL